jgi:hypothetical protein
MGRQKRHEPYHDQQEYDHVHGTKIGKRFSPGPWKTSRTRMVGSATTDGASGSENNATMTYMSKNDNT